MSPQSRDPARGHTPDRRRSRRRSDWRPILALAAVAAVGAAGASAEPTGIAVFDAIERAMFAATLTLFSACSRRWTWLVLAGAATILAGPVAALVCGVIALGFATYSAWGSHHRDRLTGAMVGALCAQSLLRTVDVGPFGLTAAATAALFAMVAVSGYRTMRTRNRRRVRVTVAVGAACVITASAVAGFVAMGALGPLEDGIAAARAGMREATGADQEGAAEHWRSAEASFSSAQRTLSNPLTRIADPIPVLSQHTRLASRAATSGRTVTARAARAATVAPYREIRAADGTFDLDKIDAMRDPVEATVTSMVSALEDVESATPGWLVAPVRSRVDAYTDELADAIPRAQSALGAITIAPELLGGHGHRRYLVLFTTPSESRELGGFVGAWAQLDATEGRLELSRDGRIGELNDASDPATRRITGEDEFLALHGHLQPARYLQNISASPDFPTVARVAAQLFPQAGGDPVDGVIAIDPIALAALLELTGPVDVAGLPSPLDHHDAAEFLLHGQYLALPDVDDRSDRLSDVAEATFDALTHRPLPPVGHITDVLAPMMHQNRLMAWVNDGPAEDYFEEIGLSGGFPRADGDDLVSVRVSNASANKADFYLHQTFTYDVAHDPSDGTTRGTLRGVFTNDAPASGEPAYVLGNPDTRSGRTHGQPFGSITLQVRIYSALRPTGFTVDGTESPFQLQRRGDLWVTTQTLRVDPASERRFSVTVSGTIEVARPYALTIAPQPTVHGQDFEIHVRNPATGRVQTFGDDEGAIRTFTVR